MTGQWIGQFDGEAPEAHDDPVPGDVEVIMSQAAHLEQRLGIDDNQGAGHSQGRLDVGTVQEVTGDLPTLVGHKRRRGEGAAPQRDVEWRHRLALGGPGREPEI